MAFSLVVENPFQETHTAVVGNSFATAAYDFAWAERFGQLLIQGAHESEGNESGGGFASSSGFIWITPTDSPESPASRSGGTLIMQIRHLIFLNVAAIVAGMVPSTANAGLIVFSWDLLTYVDHGVSGEDDYETSTVVQNPYQASHSASVGSTTAQTEYDISWLLDFASFDIQAAHQAEDVGGASTIRALSSGHVIFTPDSDIAFSVEAAYSYDLPAWGMTASVQVLIADPETHTNYFAEADSEDTFIGGPKQGAFAITGQGFIPAGRESLLLYTMQVRTYGSSGALATGSGHLTFTITPEPTTASLLALGGLTLVRRRRRCRR